MDVQTVKQIVRDELPGLVRADERIRQLVMELSKEVLHEKADKAETESWFNQILNELKQDREEQARKWEEERRSREENNRKWDEQNRKWEENQHAIRFLMKKSQKFETTIGALGARWGIRSEASFRNGLKGILEENFDIHVLNINEYDDEGEVFGRPDQVELDLIMINGILLIGEIKSSVSKADMYLFHRKAQFYEKRHNRKAKHCIVISPMVDEKAKKVAKDLGIKVYSYIDEITAEDLS